MIGVILSNNFYFSGTIRENIDIGGEFNESEAIEFINLLGLNMDLQDFAEEGL
jgi:ABC-type bacteriocin/lantibiotic exporter with double-glycine peptidase domain